MTCAARFIEATYGLFNPPYGGEGWNLVQNQESAPDAPGSQIIQILLCCAHIHFV